MGRLVFDGFWPSEDQSLFSPNEAIIILIFPGREEWNLLQQDGEVRMRDKGVSSCESCQTCLVLGPTNRWSTECS